MGMDQAFDLSDLGPDDLKALMAQISGGEGAPPDGGDPHARIEKLCEAVEFLVNEIETLGQRVTDLQTLVIKDLFGAINDQYQANSRSQGIASLSAKFGSMLEPHMGTIKALQPDADPMSELYEMISKAREANPEMDDEGADGLASSSIQELIDRLSAAKGGAPADASVEISTEEPPKEETPKPAAKRVSELARSSALKMIR